MELSSSYLRKLLLSVLLLSALPGAVHRSFAQSWTATGVSNSWTALACSADGTKLVAGSSSGWPPGCIYISTNSGISWFSNSFPFNPVCCSVACSADGTKLIAGMLCNWVYTSTDSGVTWRSNSLPQSTWAVVASPDGNKLIAADAGNGPVYISTNSGTTWISNNVSLKLRDGWPRAALGGLIISADGAKLLAIGTPIGGTPGGAIYISTNSGVSWEMTSAPNTNYFSVACSADAHTVVAGALVGESYFDSTLFLSTDSGATWRNVSNFPGDRMTVTCSADGQSMMAATGYYYSGRIYTSRDSGTTWTASSAPGARWCAVTASADGSKLVAAVSGGRIHIWEAPPKLKLTPSRDHLVLSWPNTPSAADFSVEVSTSLASDSSWTPLTNGAAISGESYTLTNTVGVQNRFYRLRKR